MRRDASRLRAARALIKQEDKYNAMDEIENPTEGTQPSSSDPQRPLRDLGASGTFKGFASNDPTGKDQPVQTEKEGKSAGDSLINAVVMVGLAVAAVALWEVAVVAAVAVAVVAVTVAVLESQEESGNIFDHKGNIVTAVGLGVATLLFGTGNFAFGLAATGLALLPQLDRISNFLTGFNFTETTWWIILLIIAIIIFALKNGKFKDWMAPRFESAKNSEQR